MSWHFSQALEAAYSEANCLDGGPSALWKSMPFAPDDSCSDKMKGTFHRSPFGMMFVPSTDRHGAALLTSYRVGFLARILATRETAKESQGKSLDSGEKWHGSFARYDHATHSLKMSQLSLIGDSERSLEIWPRWGWMQNGACFHLADAVQHTHGKECSFWLTPTVSDAADRALSVNSRGEPKLSGQFKLRHGKKMPASFAEWIMRWPAGWTGLQRLGTDRMQEWYGKHGRF